MIVTGHLEIRIDRNQETPCLLHFIYAMAYAQYYTFPFSWIRLPVKR